VLGPIASTVWKVESNAFEHVTFERWDVPGGASTLEASIKIKTADRTAIEPRFVVWLEKRGLSRAKVQRTKTAAALEALAASL
jgi:hypothetical protein